MVFSSFSIFIPIFTFILIILLFVLLPRTSKKDFTQTSYTFYSRWYNYNNNRTVFIATPKSKKPANGWPYLIWLQFMDQDGNLQGWGADSIFGSGIVSNYQDIQSDNFRNIQEIMNYAISKNIKVISTGQLFWDSLFYRSCNTGIQTADDPTDPNNLCWNNGYNPDNLIFQQLFDKLKEGKPPFDVDYNKMGVFGYSVGAQFVSRMFNEFPTTSTSAAYTTNEGIYYPKINYAIMVGGGSYGCYDYNYTGRDSDVLPSNYIPCTDQVRGCCPHNYTEAIQYGTSLYTSLGGTSPHKAGVSPQSDHPPVLLLQTESDEAADPNASGNYYKIMNEGGASVYKNIIDSFAKTVPGNVHGVVDVQVPVAKQFLDLYN